MNCLLDTHALLWWISDGSELSEKVRAVIANPENLVAISAASIWEIRIKESLGKIQVPENFENILDGEPFEKLSVTHSHSHAVRHLPTVHRDPFDRLLIAQATVENLTVITHDEMFLRYSIPINRV